MAGHSRPKDGVALLAYVPAIPVFVARKAWMPGTRPGMTWLGLAGRMTHYTMANASISTMNSGLDSRATCTVVLVGSASAK